MTLKSFWSDYKGFVIGVFILVVLFLAIVTWDIKCNSDTPGKVYGEPEKAIVDTVPADRFKQ